MFRGTITQSGGCCGQPGTLSRPLAGMLVEAGLCSLSRWDPFKDFLSTVGPGGFEDRAVAVRAWELYADLVAGVPVAAVDEYAQRIWNRQCGEVFSFALPLIAALRATGLEPVLVSAGPRELVARAAGHLDVALFAGTVMAQRRGLYDGTFSGVPTLGKPAVVQALFQDCAVDWAHSLALGNSLTTSVCWSGSAFRSLSSLQRRCAGAL